MALSSSLLHSSITIETGLQLCFQAKQTSLSFSLNLQGGPKMAAVHEHALVLGKPLEILV